ncbi:hypothetical protein ANCDUO_19436, partial [Ancylostoma duodenale]
TVKDIHTCLEVTVYDEDPNNKFEFLGKVVIPLMSIKNCERRWYALKDKKLNTRVKGEILLELDVIWNPVRAAIRTFNPRERKFIEVEKKFKIFVVSVYYVELYHVPLALLVLFAKCLIYKRVAEELSPRFDNSIARYDEDGEEEK